ncbi:MAG: MBL fold metallo-hydrolase [Candidatus Eremiobacteraeota bacterium]|nr:MBL fold metallo-hydrolase [Candidatus Eremiobacteraeota bacterium]
MPKEPVPIMEDVLMCPGDNKVNCFFKPFVPNTFVVREGSTLFVIDTGAGKSMKEMLQKAVNQLRGDAKKLVLINTHTHIDHVGNNKSIMSLEGFDEKHHLMHEAGEKTLGDPYSYLLNVFRETDRYYDVFEGPPPPWRFFTRLMSIGSRQTNLDKLVGSVLKKYDPVESSPETGEFLKRDDMGLIKIGSGNVEELRMSSDVVSIDLGPRTLKGWTIDEAVIWAEESHSPDHIMILFPGKKLLISGDLTIDLFPTLPNHPKSELAIKNMSTIKDLATEEIITTLADSHHNGVCEGMNSINTFIQGIIDRHKSFRDTLISCFDGESEGETGETINDLYRKLRKKRFDNRAVDFHLEQQFPVTPAFLKSIICTILLEMGCSVEGSGKKARFLKP